MAAMAETDLFYYDHSNEELNSQLPEFVESQIKWTALEMVRQNIIEYASDEIKSQIEPKTSEIFCDYDWTVDTLTEFFSAKDKGAFLNTLKVNKYYYPIYYQGKPLENFRATITHIPTYQFPYTPLIMSEKEIDPTVVSLQCKDRLKTLLEDNGFQGYSPILTIHYWEYWFCYATNGEEDAVIYLYSGLLFPDKLFTAKPYDKFTVNEFLEYLSTFTKNIEKSDNINNINNAKNPEEKVVLGPSSAANTTTDAHLTQSNEPSEEITTQNNESTNISSAEAETQSRRPVNNSLLWIALGGVLLIGGVLTVILLCKNKKSSKL